jgi:hypothetical protein
VERHEVNRPEKPTTEVEREVAAPPPNAQAEASAGGVLFPPQGSTPTMIDFTSNDPPSDKGKQKMDVETVDAAGQVGTSVVPDDDMVVASTRWPNFMELALMWMEEELPR